MPVANQPARRSREERRLRREHRCATRAQWLCAPLPHRLQILWSRQRCSAQIRVADMISRRPAGCAARYREDWLSGHTVRCSRRRLRRASPDEREGRRRLAAHRAGCRRRVPAAPGHIERCAQDQGTGPGFRRASFHEGDCLGAGVQRPVLVSAGLQTMDWRGAEPGAGYGCVSRLATRKSTVMMCLGTPFAVGVFLRNACAAASCLSRASRNSSV